jgi:hypothetical protein
MVKTDGDGDIYYYDATPVYRDTPDGQFELNGDGTREGLFNPNNKYLVLDAADRAVLLKLLSGCDDVAAPPVPFALESLQP